VVYNILVRLTAN